MDGLEQMTEGYHYTASGLDYVYLQNGYTVHEHPKHGRGVSIENARGLHQVIASLIVSSPAPLRGQEVRFLRSQLKLSQAGLARVLQQERGSVARWEADPNKPIPGAADSALRLFYALSADGHELAKKIVDLLADIDDLEHQMHVLQFVATGGGWKKAA
jgi:DNA-binding transcriptional regulator YiaG